MQIDTPWKIERKKRDKWLTCNFPNSVLDTLFIVVIMVTKLLFLQFDLQYHRCRGHPNTKSAGNVWNSDYIVGQKQNNLHCVNKKTHGGIIHRTVRRKRQPDTDFFPTSLNSVMPLINFSTTSLHQLYLLIFSISAIAWNACTHKLGFEVGHKNELMANSSQYHSHKVSLLFFPSPNSQFLASVKVGAFWSFSWLKTL